MNRRLPVVLDTREKKLLGVCAGLGRTFNVDPIVFRIAFVAVPLLTFITVWQAILAYVICGVIGAAARGRRRKSERPSEFDRMEFTGRRTSVHEMRTTLDGADRRMMAIDHHLHDSDSDALAREIEALRREDAKPKEEEV